MVEVGTLSRDKMFEAVVVEDKSVCGCAASSSECFLFCLQQDTVGKGWLCASLHLFLATV